MATETVMNGQKPEVLVIGAGPGGYACALKAAMLGAKVTIVERDSVGGTCLNRGCIPTKALQHAADLYEQIKRGSALGISVSDVQVDFNKVDAHRNQVVTGLSKGVESLLQARGVTLVRGEASFTAPKTVAVTATDGSVQEISAEYIVIAAGSKTAIPPIPGIDGKNVITSTEALDVRQLPESIAIIGGGVIGMEIGAVYAAFGVKVVVVEALPKLLPNICCSEQNGPSKYNPASGNPAHCRKASDIRHHRELRWLRGQHQDPCPGSHHKERFRLPCSSHSGQHPFQGWGIRKS